jgi:hypothetical protein
MGKGLVRVKRTLIWLEIGPVEQIDEEYDFLSRVDSFQISRGTKLLPTLSISHDGNYHFCPLYNA